MPQTGWHLRKTFISCAPKVACCSWGRRYRQLSGAELPQRITGRFCWLWNILMLIVQTSAHRCDQTLIVSPFARFDRGQLWFWQPGFVWWGRGGGSDSFCHPQLRTAVGLLKKILTSHHMGLWQSIGRLAFKCNSPSAWKNQHHSFRLQHVISADTF